MMTGEIEVKRFIPVVVLFTGLGTAHAARADMNSEMDAWDTFVNTNELLTHMRELRHEMQMRLIEERNRQLMQATPTYVPPSAYELELEREARAKRAPNLSDFDLDENGRLRR
jgi:hypothetical protein